MERTHYFQQLVPPWKPLQEAVTALMAGVNDPTFTFIYVGRVAGTLVAVVLLGLAVRRLPLPDVLFGWTNLVLVLSSSWLIALPRYLLALYPLFVVGARVSRPPAVFVPLVLAGAALQGWLMWRYSVGHWTF